MTVESGQDAARCNNLMHCSYCIRELQCEREPQHKGFHAEDDHRWDEYGDVTHV